MNKNIKLSIIIPHYCTQKNLFKKCMESILQSKEECYEVLVIDDGSPKEYRELLDEIAKDVRVHIIFANHKGVSAARNIGIQEAKGTYITFVDSDDYFNTDTFYYIINHINEYNGDVEIFNGGLHSVRGIINNTSFLQENYNYCSFVQDKISIMESALSAGMLPLGYIQKFSYGSPYCKLLKRSFIETKNLVFDEDVKLAEDVLFMLGVYNSAHSIYYHNKILYYYVENAQSVTRKYRPNLSKDADVFFNRVKRFLEQHELFNDLEKAYYLRAQFELTRCFYLEFFNQKNDNKEAKEQYKIFRSKEPYRTGVALNYMPTRGYKGKILKVLVNHDMGYAYKLLGKIKNAVTINR